jgi:xylulokinase
MEGLYFTADIGSSSLKGSLLDVGGGLVAFERIEFPWARDPRLAWSAQAWVAAFAALSGRLLPKLEGRLLSGVAISGNGPTLVPMDAAGRPLGAILRWSDPDSRVAGQKSFFLPKAAWFKSARPDLFEKTAGFLTCPEYITFLLTGSRAAASPSPAFSAYVWDKAGFQAYDLDEQLFPPLVEPGTRLGRVSAAGEALLGFRRDTPVYSAGSDFLMALLGTAAVRPGLTCDRAGTSEGINH